MGNKYTNWFDVQRQKYAAYEQDSWIRLLDPVVIQRDAKKRIFREIVQGRIDYAEDGIKFTEQTFLANLMKAAEDEINEKSCILNDLILSAMINGGSVTRSNLISKYTALTRIYNSIYSCLSIVKATGNIGPLAQLQYKLTNEARMM